MVDEINHPLDPWHPLKRYTPARIAIGRAGGSLPTRELLDFQLAHARARDAVHLPFDVDRVQRELTGIGVEALVLQSAAAERRTFLSRPDLGRRLDDASRAVLAARPKTSPDVAIVVSDGLAALAVHRQVRPVLEALVPLLGQSRLSHAPVVIVRHGRVAVEDEVGELLGARAALILIGERPGLGSPDSLGAYLVFDPRPVKTDADRNCVSNIRPAGLPPAIAAGKIHYLLTESLRRQISGVALKERSPAEAGQISNSNDPTGESRGPKIIG